MSLRIVVSIGVAFVILAAVPRAQNGPAGQVPTFRSEVRLLQIDAVVRDDDGHFVPHLTKDDFELLEDGKPQEILAVSEVNLPLDARGRPAATVDAGTASPATGIAADTGRVYVMVLSSAGRTRQIAREFVENYFGPADLMAVLSGGIAVTHGLSGDKAELLDAIDHGSRASGSLNLAESIEPPKREACDGANERIKSLRTLREVVVNLSAVGGRRKAILYFSNIANQNMDFEDCTPVRREYDEMVRTAVRNDVRIYPIDPRGFMVDFPEPAVGGKIAGELGGIVGNLPQRGTGVQPHLVNDTAPQPGQNLGFGGGMMVSASPGNLGATMAARILANDTGGMAIANTVEDAHGNEEGRYGGGEAQGR